MTAGMRLQGKVFCGLALVWVMASGIGIRLAPFHELWAAGALIALLGMPHGAFDVVFARRLFGVVGAKGWALFSLLYIGLAAAVVGVWWVAPTFFLCAFLACSALHFGGDPAAGTSVLARGLYGGAVIVLPALWHGPELQQLLALVAGPASAALVAPVLGQMAALWLAGLALAAALLARTSRLAAAELAALAALSVTAPPLVAFTVYFCAMHSPRHVLRTLAGFSRLEIRNAWGMAKWPTLAVLVVLVVSMVWMGVLAAAAGGTALEVIDGRPGGPPMPAWAMQIIFVGLAALTLPHMVLLERARQAGLTTPP